MFSKLSDTKVHFIGIGGIGMSGIAEVLLRLGFKVSGSDQIRSANTDKLTSLGADVYICHKAKNIRGATVVVYSSAISKDNPEIKASIKNEIPVMRRAKYWQS